MKEYDLGTQYGDAVRLDMRDGRYSLIMVKNRDGKSYVQYCSPLYRGEPRRRKDGDLVAIPLGVTIGYHDKAADFARWLLDALGDDRQEVMKVVRDVTTTMSAHDDEDIPF